MQGGGEGVAYMIAKELWNARRKAARQELTRHACLKDASEDQAHCLISLDSSKIDSEVRAEIANERQRAISAATAAAKQWKLDFELRRARNLLTTSADWNAMTAQAPPAASTLGSEIKGKNTMEYAAHVHPPAPTRATALHSELLDRKTMADNRLAARAVLEAQRAELATATATRSSATAMLNMYQLERMHRRQSSTYRR
eukprot:SAG31_NODE_4802_length_2947_cov_2.732093_2_plen_200_part_00